MACSVYDGLWCYVILPVAAIIAVALLLQRTQGLFAQNQGRVVTVYNWFSSRRDVIRLCSFSIFDYRMRVHLHFCSLLRRRACHILFFNFGINYIVCFKFRI